MSGARRDIDEPLAVLGLRPGCSVDDVHAARRRLSKHVHPDVGGDAARMQRVNAAADQLLARLGASVPVASSPERPDPAADADRSGSGRSAPNGRRAHDHPSFTIEALPVEAFEALLLVARQLGEVIDDDPPYVLEAALTDPIRGWCRVDLVPDAGASTVSLVVGAEPGGRMPDLEQVRDAWIEGLNALDWSDPGGPLPPS